MRKKIGILFIIGGILVLLFLNQMIEPAVLGETDSSEYYIKMIINGARYIVLACIFAAIGIKFLFDKD